MFSGLNIGDVLQTVFEKLWRLSGFEMTEVIFKTDHLINSTWTEFISRVPPETTGKWKDFEADIRH